MPGSKLKENLKSTIQDSAKNPDDKNLSNKIANTNVFEQARQNSLENDQLATNVERIKPGEQKKAIVDEVAKKTANKNTNSRKIEKTPFGNKQITPPDVRQKRNYMSSSALVISIVAALIAGYSVYKQGDIQSELTKTTDSLNMGMYNLAGKSENFTKEILILNERVTINARSLAALDAIHVHIAGIDKQIEDKHEEIEIMKGRIDRHDKTFETHATELKELGFKIKKFTARRVTPSESTKKVTIVKKAYDNPNKLNGAVVASIDIWGTQQSVMLHNESGKWIPMSIGDYYKGWRLSGLMGSEAVFKKGKKIRKLTIEE